MHNSDGNICWVLTHTSVYPKLPQGTECYHHLGKFPHAFSVNPHTSPSETDILILFYHRLLPILLCNVLSLSIFWDLSMLLNIWMFISFYWVVFHCMKISQFIHCPVDGHLGYFLAIMNKSAMTIAVLIFLCTCILICPPG